MTNLEEKMNKEHKHCWEIDKDWKSPCTICKELPPQENWVAEWEKQIEWHQCKIDECNKKEWGSIKRKNNCLTP